MDDVLPALGECEEEPVEAINKLSTGHRKTAFALKENVSRMCATHGIERLGFLTLTFADHVTDASEAGRRYNSLRTGVLAKRYPETIAVIERQKSGRIHFHLLVALHSDIRTGFDFEAVSHGDYRSACAELRSEWAFWRNTAPNYGFGRAELLPIKSNAEGIAKYVGKYIAKHIGAREVRDKGVRLVRYSKAARRIGCRFSWASVGSWLYRAKLEQFCLRSGCRDLEELKERLGKKWAYWFADDIKGERLLFYPTMRHAYADGRFSDEEFAECPNGIDVRFLPDRGQVDRVTLRNMVEQRCERAREALTMLPLPPRRVEVVTILNGASDEDGVHLTQRVHRDVTA